MEALRAEEVAEVKRFVSFIAHREFPERIGYASEQYIREQAQSGIPVFEPPADPPTPDWLRGIS
jgi:hypothetical protein